MILKRLLINFLQLRITKVRANIFFDQQRKWGGGGFKKERRRKRGRMKGAPFDRQIEA